MNYRQKLIVRKVKNIFDISDDLTNNLQELWGVNKPNWLTPVHYWWVVFDITDKNNPVWVGYGAARIHDQVTLYVGPTFIKEEYRGLGLQKKLLKTREKFAKKTGFSVLISSTNCDNIWSGNNLIRCGFTQRKPWDELSQHGLYWEKKC